MITDQGRAQPSPPSPRAAAERIGPYVRRTPVLRATVAGRPVAFKLEMLQVTGSFKARGALNALLSRREARGVVNHVVTASGGNHGLGVATAARLLGVGATVFVPGPVPEVKARRIAATGAEVVRVGRSYADAETEARHLATRDGIFYVHAYDDPAVVEGQSTLGLEVLADMPECDAIAVPVGGGGLLAGVTAAVREAGEGGAGGRGASARRTVVGVEPEGCAALHAAVRAGRPVDAPPDGQSVAASALGASRAGRLAFAACQSGLVGLAMVSDDAILAAQGRLWEEFRLAVEPAAATVFAAWLAGQVPGDFPCLVLSGANADWAPATAH
ncbi:MAG TPA: pyridoxal-phosphate dependent enzyme [Trebonia sp.]|nr:pyridoxal-phosphate dependent enzyme [Trebonia sp.]